MSIEFKLPDIGEGVHEGEIVKWLVKEGDTVAIDQSIVEIMTDKATVEIPTSVGGKVEKLNAKEGDTVKVGQTIMVMSGSDSKKAETKPAEEKTIEKNPISTKPNVQNISPQNDSSVLASPSTRRLAREMDIDLNAVKATGPHGRILREDVQKHTSSAPKTGNTPRTFAQPTERETLVPFRGIRRKIAEAMSRSRTTIAEFNYIDECDITDLVILRKELKDTAEKQGVKITYLPFIIKAMIQGLKQYPTLNASLDEEGGNIIIKNYFNIGIAVDTDAGLVVPVIKNADQKSILEIAREIQVLADKARHGKLALEDMQGATITITNPGPIGGLITTPVINWPEVAIMGVHKIVRKPVVKNEKIEIADMMFLSIAVDHRVVDGATAARFMNLCMEYLSKPSKLLLEMA